MRYLGQVDTDTLRIRTGAANSYVLTSDASGNASWAAPSGGGSYVKLTPTASADNLIQPSGNYIVLILRNHSSQAVNIIEQQNSSGTVQTSLSYSGQWVFADTTPATNLPRISISTTLARASGAASHYVVYVDAYANPANAGGGGVAYGLFMGMTVNSANTFTQTYGQYVLVQGGPSVGGGGTYYGAYFRVGANTSYAGAPISYTSIIGATYESGYNTAGSGTEATITTQKGLYVAPPFLDYCTITTHYGIHIGAVAPGTSTTVTTTYGIKVDDITAGTTIYAIRTGKGQILFGDKLGVTGWQDVVQATIKAYSSQTASIQEWQNSSGTVLSGVNSDGRIRNATNAGTPTGKPANGTTVYDTTANKLWVYNGAWKSVALT